MEGAVVNWLRRLGTYGGVGVAARWVTGNRFGAQGPGLTLHHLLDLLFCCGVHSDATIGVLTMNDGDASLNALDLFIDAWEDFTAGPTMTFSVVKSVHRRCRKALDMDSSLADRLPRVNEMLGLLNCSLGICAADEELEESKAYYQEAIKLLESSNDLLWCAHWMLGKALKEVGDVEKSISAFQKAVQLAIPWNAKGPEPTNDQLSLLFGEFARVYLELERPGDAADCYESAVLYDPGSRHLQAALLVSSWYARRYDRVVESSTWVLAGENQEVVPPLVRELVAIAAIRTGKLEVAVEAYEKLLAECNNPKAREWYSRMLGYVEGHRDSCENHLLWNVEGFKWTSWCDRYDTEGKPMSLDQAVDVIREDTRDNIGRFGLQLLSVKEWIERIRSPDEERGEVSERLRRDVFGDALWQTLTGDTQETLVQAELLGMATRRSSGKDYFSTVVAYNKAFQWELAARILVPFGSYLAAKGLLKVTITGEEWDCRKLKNMRLSKVADLFQGWRLLLSPKMTVSQADVRFLLPEPARQHTQEFLRKYRDEQTSLIIELTTLLNWMPHFVREAQHTAPVSSEDLGKLRSALIGSHAKPGLMIGLIRLFPAGQ